MVRSSLALGALLLSGAVVAAPESLMKVDTTKGEILLEVQANGVRMAKIDKVSIACDLGATGDTKAEAEKALLAAQQAMRANFDGAGLGAVMLDFSAFSVGANRYEFEVDVADSAAEAAGIAAAAAVEAAGGANYGKTRIARKKRVTVTAQSMQDLELARSLFAEGKCNEDYTSIRRPNIILADGDAAKNAATGEAIEAAKAQAERYAMALGKRVVRIVRVSETGAIREFLGAESDVFITEMRRDRDRNLPVTNEAPVTVSVAVDFVLGPK